MTDDGLRWLLPILERSARQTRTDVLDSPPGHVAMTRVEIERGLGDGTLTKGVTERTAEGGGDKPPPGHLMLPGDIDKVWPMPKGREVVGWLVVGPGYRWSAATTRWRVPVVAVGRS